MKNKRYFNIAGPCIPDKHYMLDPMRGINDDLMRLIETESYFVIHAARQSGKTTLLKSLTEKINKEGKYYALYCSLEAIQDLTNPREGIPEIVKKIEMCLENQEFPQGFAKNADYDNFTNVLISSVANYCRLLDKPLLVFFDEADCLSNGTLITFLRQLREGYINRPKPPFIHSLALVGMHNIRDYKAKIRPESETLGSTSPFNIVTKSYNLRNFTFDEITELYSQHTEETGQVFIKEVIEFIYEQTGGQPWLVNAIAREIIEEIFKNDYSKQITKELAEIAIQNIILARGTHFDSLMERLKEERVRRVILPLLQGEENIDRQSDDFIYVNNLGLIKLDEKTRLVVPANPIYAEIMVRALNLNIQLNLSGNMQYEMPKYFKDDKIDMNYLLKDFQAFWRENSEIIWDKLNDEGLREYKEASPHLVLQAFLQRVINGGGQIIREMALGAKRADLCVVYKGFKYPIEIKILRGEKSLLEGLKQTSEYADKCGCNEGWLVIFDRDSKKSWNKKIYMQKKNIDGKKVTIIGV